MLTLSWDILNARLVLDLTVSSPIVGQGPTSIQVVDSAVIPINTNTRRLVAFNVNPIYGGGEISLSVDGVLVGFTNNSVLTTVGFPLGGMGNTLAAMSIGADLNGSSIFVGSISDVVVSKNAHGLSQDDLRYLLAFQYPQISLPNGSCAAQCLQGDTWCPQNATVFFFTKTGFSFPGSKVQGGNRFTFPTSISSSNLAQRAVAWNTSVANQSWPSSSGLNCGISQRASVALPKVDVAFDVDITITWSAEPQPTDTLTVQDSRLHTLVTINGSTLLALRVQNSFQISLVTFASATSFTFTLIAGTMVANNTFAGGQYCTTEVSLRERAAVVLYPSTSIGGIGNNQTVKVLTGVIPSSDAMAIVNISQTCASLSRSQLMWPLTTVIIVQSNSPELEWSATTLALPPLPVDVYTICIIPRGLTSQAYAASRCNTADPKSPFLCTYIVSYIPTFAQPLRNDWVTHLLHLGSGPSDGVSHGLFNVDYFASTGGEANIQPQAGNSLNALVWTEMQSASGLWALPPNISYPPQVEQVQYFAIAVYASHAQTISISLRFANALCVWFDAASVFGTNLGINNIPESETNVYSTGFISVGQGWHQLILKLWVAPSSVTSLLALRFDQTDSLAWAYSQQSGSAGNANFTVVCAMDGSLNVSSPCLPGNPALNHDECVALGCCFQQINASTSSCLYPITAAQPYRTDGHCGVSFPSLIDNISQCDASNIGGDGCCSKQGVCGSGLTFCDCPTCSNYFYTTVARSRFVPWGNKARCLNALAVSIGFGFFSTCATACNMDAQCTAFSLSSSSVSGGYCVLYMSDCSQTLMDNHVDELFARFSSNCGFPNPQLGVMCSGTRAANLVGNMSLSDCMHLCNVTTLCAGVQYRPHASTQCSFLVQSNCSVLPLAPASPADVYAVFMCDGDSVNKPVPFAQAPNLTALYPVGCFVDPSASFLARPSSAYAGAELPSPQYIADYTVLPLATIGACKVYCEHLGAPFFATSNGSVCTCDVNYDLSSATSSLCETVPCPGNTSQFCGGPASAALYRIGYRQETCPTGSFYFKQFCYSYFGSRPENMLNFSRARSACAALNGFSLVSIHNLDEAQFVLGLSLVHNTSNRMSWTGGLVAPDGTLSWVDGSPVDYTDWLLGQPMPASSQPNNASGMVLRASGSSPINGSWSTAYDMTMPLPYVCKMRSGVQTSDVPLILYASTDEGAFACVSQYRAASLKSQVEAFYSLNYGAHFIGDVIPDNSAYRRPLRAVYNYSSVSDRIAFVGGIMQTALNFTGQFSLQAETVWDISADVLSVSVWIAPSNALFSTPTSEVFVVGRSAVASVDPVAPPSSSAAAYTWAVVLRPQEGLVCFVIGLQRVCSVCNASTIAAGPWLHVVGVFDGASLLLYINITLASQQSLAANVNITNVLHNSTQKFTVGFRAATPFVVSMVYAGLMDDLRLYSQVFDASQIRYLFLCTPYASPSNVLFVYQGSAGVRVHFKGTGFNPGQLALMTTSSCQVGNLVTNAPYPLSTSLQAGGSIVLAASDLSVPSIPGQAAYFHICFVNTADNLFIAGSASLEVGIVVVTAFASTSISFSVTNLTTTLLPTPVSISGINLVNSQVLVFALDGACTEIVSGPILIVNATTDGSSAVVMVPTSTNPRTSSVLTVCWGASSSATVFHPTTFLVTGVPYPPSAIPTSEPGSSPTTSAPVYVIVGVTLAALVVLVTVTAWCRRQTKSEFTAEADAPLNDVKVAE
jgi:hypothetical protein